MKPTRNQHEAGLKLLNKLFGWDEDHSDTRQTGHSIAAPDYFDAPNARNRAARKVRIRRRNKIARLARKANR